MRDNRKILYSHHNQTGYKKNYRGLLPKEGRWEKLHIHAMVATVSSTCRFLRWAGMVLWNHPHEPNVDSIIPVRSCTSWLRGDTVAASPKCRETGQTKRCSLLCRRGHSLGYQNRCWSVKRRGWVEYLDGVCGLADGTGALAPCPQRIRWQERVAKPQYAYD